jgi:UDP-N-acetylmuramoyl-tripeptide--D-alanyl-D-alanine ligase
MDPLTLSTLAQMSGASLLAGDPHSKALRVSKDTRSILPGDLYVAIRGERFDGNQYLQEAAAKGAVAALCDGEAAMGLPSNFGILSTADVLSSLALLASEWRSRLKLTSVVITGSSGKTSTKDFSKAVMHSRFKTTATDGNLNNHIGLPLSILAADSEDQIAIWEIGMNHRGEIAPLAGMAKPDIGIITGIGTAHIEHLGSRQAIAHEKGDLLERLPSSGFAILPANDDFLGELRTRTEASILEVGFDAGNIRATHFQPEATGSRFVIEGDYGRAEAFLPIPGKHMVGNALLAVAAGLLTGVSLTDSVAGLVSVQLTGGRLERIEKRGVTLIDDTYNANPESMVAALETLSSLPGKGNRIAVLGKMGELGDYAARGYEQVGKAAALFLKTLICVGSEASAIADAATAAGLTDVRLVPDRSEAASLLSTLAQSGDFVLLKASRSVHMEEVINQFN